MSGYEGPARTVVRPEAAFKAFLEEVVVLAGDVGVVFSWIWRAGSQSALLPFCMCFRSFLRCSHQAFLGLLAVMLSSKMEDFPFLFGKRQAEPGRA